MSDSLAKRLVSKAGAAKWKGVAGRELSVAEITPQKCIETAVVAVLRELGAELTALAVPYTGTSDEEMPFDPARWDVVYMRLSSELASLAREIEADNE